MTPLGQYQTLDSRNLIGMFNSLYEPAIGGAWAPRIGTVVPSDRGVEEYGFLGAPAQMEEMTSGDLPAKELNQYSYTLRNREFARTINIAAKDLRRDKVGQLERRINDLAVKAADHWNKLASTVITANPNGYDGVALFASTHAESGTNQSNLLTASDVASLNVTTAAAPTADEAAESLVGVTGKFFEFTDDQGDPANGNARNFTVMVGTSSLWAAFSHAINSDRLSGGEANRVLGISESQGINFNVVLNPYISSVTDSFFVFRTDAPWGALLLQDEVPVTPNATDMNSDQYKLYHRFVFSVYASRNVGVGRWHSGIKATFS